MKLPGEAGQTLQATALVALMSQVNSSCVSARRSWRRSADVLIFERWESGSRGGDGREPAARELLDGTKVVVVRLGAQRFLGFVGWFPKSA